VPLLGLRSSIDVEADTEFRLSAKLGTTWEQLRPNTGKNEGAGPTRKQDESTT
jgi:hypothetical protein